LYFETGRPDFLRWLAAKGYWTAPSSATGTIGSTIAIDERLLRAAKHRIVEIVAKRHLKIGDMMVEMGFPKLNASLGRAFHRGDRLQPNVIAALQKWLAANAAI